VLGIRRKHALQLFLLIIGDLPAAAGVTDLQGCTNFSQGFSVKAKTVKICVHSLQFPQHSVHILITRGTDIVKASQCLLSSQTIFSGWDSVTKSSFRRAKTESDHESTHSLMLSHCPASNTKVEILGGNYNSVLFCSRSAVWC